MSTMTLSQKRSAAGKLGWRATLERHGREHFKKIGKKGARVFHGRYKLEPYGIGDFAVVNRETNEIKAFLSGMPF